ncbi:MAG: Tnp 1-associated, partial [Micromonosporaceae bacterium]
MDVFCPLDAQASPAHSRDLFAVLDTLPDPRPSGWRRHPLGYVLAVVFTAFTLPGFGSLAAVAQWAGDPAGPCDELLRLGVWPDPFDGRIWPPSEPTTRTILT